METPTVLDLTDSQERWLVRLLRVVLLGLAAYGFALGNAGVAVNATGSLVVSLLPTLARWETDVGVDPGLVLWLTVATTLHAVGTLGPYRNRFWWDYVTHALSASIVVGIAFGIVRAVDRRDNGIELPEPALSAFMFLFVLAMGVFWEMTEFLVTRVSQAMGRQSVLIVFGLQDIMTDLLFTVIGGVLVVLWGRGYFRPLSAKVATALSR